MAKGDKGEKSKGKKKERQSEDLKQSITTLISIVNEAILDAVEGEMAKQGLTVSTFHLLSAIEAADGKESQAKIAERLGIRPPSLSEALRAVTKAGFVEQVSVEGDNRSKRLHLTTAGKSALDGTLERVSELDKTITKSLKKSARAELMEHLGAALKAVQELPR